MSDGGPAFYRARRVGRGGEEFALLKFRTMVIDADKRGGGLTAARDTRITPIGRFLRRTKCDELPQLFNVFMGDMSFVGPRPEDPRFVRLYSQAQRQVLAIRPGITSAASLYFRNESDLLSGSDPEGTYIQTILPQKLAIELNYMRSRSILSDVRVILLTIQSMFTGEEGKSGVR
jgi:lipopolysaccharide/colanic/teichoic acid biosynthesis glycosyltransferase